MVCVDLFGSLKPGFRIQPPLQNEEEDQKLATATITLQLLGTCWEGQASLECTISERVDVQSQKRWKWVPSAPEGRKMKSNLKKNGKKGCPISGKSEKLDVRSQENGGKKSHLTWNGEEQSRPINKRWLKSHKTGETWMSDLKQMDKKMSNLRKIHKVRCPVSGKGDQKSNCSRHGNWDKPSYPSLAPPVPPSPSHG